jgi:hypothetical protein
MRPQSGRTDAVWWNRFVEGVFLLLIMLVVGSVLRALLPEDYSLLALAIGASVAVITMAAVDIVRWRQPRSGRRFIVFAFTLSLATAGFALVLYMINR